MNNNYDIITPQFQIYNIYDKNDHISEVVYEFKRRYIKPEVFEIVTTGLNSWKNTEYRWLIGPEKTEVTSDLIKFSIAETNKYLPLINRILKKNSIEEILKTVINITEKYALINSRNILNRSIKTSNILVGNNDIKIKLSPLNLFCDLFYGKDTVPDEECILTDLVYLAPEHFNSDELFPEGGDEIYSLGVIFYELFSGITPFRSTEYDELIYSHLFRDPVPISNFNLDITPEISDVISRMLKKSPFDRYITFNGLLYDLGLCKKALSDFKKTKFFITGTKDIPRTLIIPDKLYGREEHANRILELFNETKKGTNNAAFISGPSGIGKTSLIKKTLKPLITSSGIFITGKCENRTKNIPYEPFIKALNQLIRPILVEPQEIQGIWKESILNAVGNNGGIITELIPPMHQILGEQPPLPALSGEENRNRINSVLLKFLNVFIESARVFVLFIDDMQWIDNTTLSLLKYIITSKAVKSFLLISSYRDNEVSEFHSLHIFRNEITSSGISCTEMNLKHLELNSICQMLSETIRTANTDSLSLAELALKYTKGNPLYLKEFMTTLYREKLLRFDDGRGWEWDNTGIIDLYESEDFVSTMISRMNSLPLKSQEFLKYAACIGSSFNLAIISAIKGDDENEIHEITDLLATEGFIESNGIELKFIHDRVHESAEAIINSRAESAEIHYKIADYLFTSMTQNERDENIFIIANHFNAAIEILNTEEKKRLIEINYRAGEKAKNSVAYELALMYYHISADIAEKLEVDNNDKIEIYHECFICEYLNENYENAYSLFNIMMNLCDTNAQKARIYKTNVLLLMHLSKPDMAIEMGLIGLKMLGVKTSKNPGKLEIIKEYIKTKIWLQRKDYNTILSMDNIKNPDILMAMELMYTLWMPTYASNKNLMKLLSLKMANFTMKYGLCHISPFAFITLGMIFGTGREHYSEGYEFGRLALQMTENKTIMNREVECVINVFFASFHAQWMKSYEYSIPFFKKAHDLGTKYGIIYYSRLSRVFYTATRLLKGDNLDNIMKESLEQINSMHLPGNAHWYAIMSMIKNIFYMQEGDTDFFYKDMKLDDTDFLNNLKKLEVRQPLHWFTVFRSKALLIFQKFDDALINMEIAESVLHWHFASSIITEHCFIQSIAILNRTIKKDILNRFRYSIILRRNLRNLKKAAKSSPENFLHKYFLVMGEKNKKRIHSINSTKYYDMAIQQAQKTGLINDLALIYDMQASYTGKLNLKDSEKRQIEKAHFYYNLWGAKKKVEDMEIKHKFLRTSIEVSQESQHTSEESNNSLLFLFENILKAKKEDDPYNRIKNISEILYNNDFGERIILLLKDEKSLSASFVIDSNGLTYYEKAGNKDLPFFDDITELIKKTDNSEEYFTGIIDTSINKTNTFYAALPIINSKNIEGYFVLQKHTRPFTDMDKRIIRILASILQDTGDKNIWMKHKAVDLKKDLISSNLNDLIRNRLLKTMELDKIFLTEDLTLTMLAKELETSPQQLSEYINNNLNMNFNSFINRYRIEEAKKILAEDPERPVLNIAYDVGFNSISVFYNAFLKCEGIPPAKYRKYSIKSEIKST